MEIPGLNPEVNGNPISDLNEWCLKHQKAIPIYEEISREGPSHQPIHTMKCILGKYVEIGSGTTKQFAKKVAANKVLTRIVQAEGSHLPMQKEVEEKEELEEKEEMEEKDEKSEMDQKTEPFRLSTWLASFKRRNGKKLLSLKNKNLIIGPNYYQALLEICEEQLFKIDSLDNEKGLDEEDCHSAISIDLKPPQVFLAKGKTRKEAREKAAEKGISFLKMALRQ